jgi:hypothetical protein
MTCRQPKYPPALSALEPSDLHEAPVPNKRDGLFEPLGANADFVALNVRNARQPLGQIHPTVASLDQVDHLADAVL